MSHKTISKLTERVQYLKDQLERVNMDIVDAAHDHNIEGRVTYLELQNRRNSLEARLKEAEREVRSLSLSKSSTSSTNKAMPGAKVTLKHQGSEFEAIFVDRPNSMYYDRVISLNSPIGKALNGKNVGESFGVSTPNGTKNYELLAVSG